MIPNISIQSINQIIYSHQYCAPYQPQMNQNIHYLFPTPNHNQRTLQKGTQPSVFQNLSMSGHCQQCPHSESSKPSQQSQNVCKVQEYPSYTYHSSVSPPQQVKQQQEIAVHAEPEPLQILMQKRAIGIALKEDRTEEEIEEIAHYRRYRLTNYLLKKQKRNFDKKIVYQTRKIVADRRIRFKGKFINEFQARQLLGIVDQSHSFEELKMMMQRLKSTS